MSAFVVGDDTMDKCVRAILRSQQYQSPLFAEVGGVPTDAVRAGTRIGRILFTMNVEAVEERYGRDEPPSLMTYQYREARVLPPYDYATRIADYKALQCLSYQCCEGAVPDSSLYLELEQVIAKIARSIIEFNTGIRKGTLGMSTYVAEIDPDPEAPCACGSCDWRGSVKDLLEIEDCALDPGDASPAGRCPEEDCESLAYLDRREDRAKMRALGMLETLEATYLALLAHPLDGWRIQNQRTYARLRRSIAEATGREEEDVQNEFESRSAKGEG